MATHFCTECGAPLADGAHFCPACGHHLDPSSGDTTATGATDPTTPTPVVGPPPSMAAPAGSPLPPDTPGRATTTPAPGGGAGRNRGLVMAGVAAVVVLVAVAVALVLTGGDEAAAEVLLEPVGVEVPDPFTATAAIGEAALDPTAATSTTVGTTAAGGADSTTSTTRAPSPGAGGGAVAGSAPGLYGGTRDQASCDPEKLVNFLESDPEKAAAWAEVQGIEVAGIRSFVADLTPVVLRRDTRVLNHGYRDGRPTPRPAVLQAGTAVLVDDHGVPRVKCACGNPLDEPRPVTNATTYTGTRWSGFDPAGVVVVRAEVRVDVFVLVDLRTGTPFRRPTASKGDDDSSATGSTTTTTTTTTTAVPTTSEGTAAPVLFEIASIAGVSNAPTALSVADLPAARITAIVTYHWNNAQGATPGTVSLQAPDGTVHGPFPTTGSPGQGGVPNAYWTATINLPLPAGRYTVIDSDPATWAWAPDTGGRGMVRIHGVATTAPPTTRPTPTTAAPADGDRSQEAIDSVQGAFCGPTAGIEDWRQYITGITAAETDFLLYRVEVRIELDSGAWTALFDVDFATEGGPEIRAVNDESADLLC